MENELSLKEIQNLNYELLVEFADFCDANNINYYLCGGTTLGAVRHQGFIPWDDDCDVMMLRKDYKRYLDVVRTKQLPKNRKVISLYDKTFARNFAKYVRLDYKKIQDFYLEKDGSYASYIALDIFPVDYVSGNDFKFLFQIKLLYILRKLQLASVTKFGTGKTFLRTILKNIYRPIAKILGPFRIARWMDAVCQWYSNTEYVGVISGMYGKKERWSKKDYDEEMLMQFRDRKFKGPKNYDIYLSNIYGDYMTLPPKEKQKPTDDVKYKKII